VNSVATPMTRAQDEEEAVSSGDADNMTSIGWVSLVGSVIAAVLVAGLAVTGAAGVAAIIGLLGRHRSARLFAGQGHVGPRPN
jgi:hypothetical protein